MARIVTIGLVLALGAPAAAQLTDAAHAEAELAAARRSRMVGRNRVQRAYYSALEDARADQRRYYEREREVEELVIQEEALVHRDRRYVAEGKPAALARKLAAELEQAAADRRMRRWGKWAKRSYPVQVRQAELWAIDAVAVELYRNERFRREVCRKVLELAEQMERRARASGQRPPARR